MSHRPPADSDNDTQRCGVAPGMWRWLGSKIQDRHSVEVTADTLYEAVATALAALRQDNWVEEIGTGLTTVHVEARQPVVNHEVKMKDFAAWLQRSGGSPAETLLRTKVSKIAQNLAALSRAGANRSEPRDACMSAPTTELPNRR